MNEQTKSPPYIRLARDIATKIHSGEYPPGFRLPPQRDLAYEYGVAPGTVSRAYAELQREGLIEATTGRGSFVRPITVEKYSPSDIDLRANRPRRRRLAPLLFRAVHESLEDFESILFDARSDPGGGRFQGEFVQAWLNKYHGIAGSSLPLLCSGGQSALVSSLLVLCQPGDVVIAEDLTYTGLIYLAKLINVQLVGAPMDEHGVIVDTLQELIAKYRPKSIVLTPNFQSPTTSLMTLERRKQISEIVIKNNITLIEDDVYGSYSTNNIPPIRSMIPDSGILFTSLSKVAAGGIPVGIISAPDNLIVKLRKAIDITGGMVDPTTWTVVKNWMSTGYLDSIVQDNRLEIANRERLARDLLSGIKFRSHSQCPHIWVEVPDLSLTAVMTRLAAVGVKVLGSDAFTISENQNIRGFRLSISAARDMKELAHALQQVVQTVEELRHSFFQII